MSDMSTLTDLSNLTDVMNLSDLMDLPNLPGTCAFGSDTSMYVLFSSGVFHMLCRWGW
jgi:hypothetical protein